MSSAETGPRFRAEDYTVGWLCALPFPELTAAEAMLDCQHEPPLNIDENDSNYYEFGDIGQHKVVLASLPCFQSRHPVRPKTHSAAQANLPEHAFPLVCGRWRRHPSTLRNRGRTWKTLQTQERPRRHSPWRRRRGLAGKDWDPSGHPL